MGVVEKVIGGDVRTAARLIREIEDGIPGTREILKELHAHTGNAYVVGITGSPGVGKSTLVDRMVHHLREQGKTVGVIAVDPSSPFSGGALLGDRIRMQRHSLDNGVFIRSLATRGHFGGLSQSTRAAIQVLDAMGKDIIIVETVGVGQGEIDIVRNAHTTVVVVIPGMGDEIQAVKAGILEIGNIFFINKSDLPGADKTCHDLKWMIDLNQKKSTKIGWKPSILMGEAISDKGVAELINEIENHKSHINAIPAELKHQNRRDRVRLELSELIKEQFVQRIFKELENDRAFDKAVASVLDGASDPYTACDELLANLIFPTLPR
jgi:LAO/AO transport system kinase